MLNKSQKPDHHVENPQAMQNHQVPVSHDLLCRLLQVQVLNDFKFILK